MTDLEHLLFSLKHDGISLPIMCELFATRKRSELETELVRAVKDTPTGQYHRRLWFLYEWLTGRELALEPSPTTTYIPLLDLEAYYTGRATRHPRHRVIDNLPGNRDFCPLVRRTEQLSRRSSNGLRDHIADIVSKFDADLLTRAIAFIYTKETRSSFAIERERPTASRAEKFASVLARASEIGSLSEPNLTSIQNRIVEPRFAEDGFRSSQNYVGESLGLHRQIVHYVAPKPEDVRGLMNGLRAALDDHTGHVPDAVVLAATIAFGFVFVHPFEDGNGRLHRFLIHHVLGRERITPPNVIVPVSAVMLAKRAEYDRCLEQFSRPLLELVDYDLDDNGYMTVTNDTARYYRYFDATPMAEALYRWLDEATDNELQSELTFLLGLREAKAAMQQIVELPDRLADLFVKLVSGNGGHLAKRKRSHFSMLSDDEVNSLEEAVRTYVQPASGSI